MLIKLPWKLHHGLVQDRLNGIKMSVGVFTNLSRDHYDFHGNINSYFDAKAILFKELVEENGECSYCY